MARDLRADRLTPGQEWMNLAEAAMRLGISVDILREWIATGRLASRSAGASGDELLVLLEPGSSIETMTQPLGAGVQHAAPDPGIAGRSQELATLVRALETARDGAGSLVLLGGEAGIGKTTLVNAVLPIAEAGGFVVLRGHCFDVEHTPPYGPWIDMFRGDPAEDDHPAPPPAFFEQDGIETIISPNALYATVEQFFLESSRRKPLVVVMEDQHWADQASLDLLRYLARRLQTAPIIFLITYRNVELLAEQPLYRVLPHFVREANALRLTLRRLDRGAVLDILRRRYALTERDEHRLTEYLWRYAEGNPFFTEELSNDLEDEGALLRDGQGWTLGELPEFRVPPIVRQVIENRLWRLSRTARDVLEVAAVLGVEAPMELWQSAADVTEEVLADCIEQALMGQLIEEIPERSSVRFRHALIQEALYDGLTILNRRARHQRIAGILAQAPNADAEAVAHHYTQARDFRAVEWLLRSGRRAALGFAYHAAIVRFEEARELLEHRPESHAELAWLLCELAVAQRYLDPRRALRHIEVAWEHASGVDDKALQAVLMRTRSHLRGFLGENGLPEAYESVDAYESLSDADRARINQTAIAYTISHGTLAQRVAYYARYEDARSLGEKFLRESDIPVSVQQHNVHGIANLGLGLAYANLGNPDAARGAFASARDHLRRAENHFLLAQTYSHEYRFVVEVYCPERVETRRSLIEGADQHYQQSIFAQMSDYREFERIYTALILDGRWDEVQASAGALIETQYMKTECAEVLALIDWYRGDYDRVWSRIALAIPAGSSAEPPTVYYHEVRSMQSIAAQVAMSSGQPEVARSWIEASERWRDWGDTVAGRYVPDYLWALYHQSLGNMELALQHARLAVGLALNPRQPLGLLRTERLLGTIAGEAGLFEDAERHLGVAVDLSRSIQAPYETALTEIEYAQLLIATSKIGGSRPLLERARTALERLGAKPALERLSQVEASLADALDQPPQAVAGLSPREVEVLQLVAQGLTDAEIGERLFISRRTVSGHLQSIFNKCGVSSRAAATAFAYEHRIVAPGS